MLKLNFFGLLLLGTTAAVSVISSPALAETFVLNGNKALNTNANFRLIDGHPRMSIWEFNPTDRDQQFTRLRGNLGGTLLQHSSTGKCLNSAYLTNGGHVNTWPCNPNDPDQNFNIIPLDNGFSQIQRTGTNLCVDSPTRDNGGTVHVWQCDRNNPNQRFRNGHATVNTTSGYYPELASLSSDLWDEYSGDNTRFDPNPQWDGRVDERAKTPPAINQIYTDLSGTIFGSRRAMNTGYLYDQSYFNGFKKWHAGFDIGAASGTPVRAVIGGTRWLIQNQVGNYFMAIRGDDGRLWIYGHLGTVNGTSGRIEAGQLVGTIGSQNHLHLEVQNNKNKYEQTSGAHSNQQFVKDVTISPLQAFWILKNR